MGAYPYATARTWSRQRMFKRGDLVRLKKKRDGVYRLLLIALKEELNCEWYAVADTIDLVARAAAYESEMPLPHEHFTHPQQLVLKDAHGNMVMENSSRPAVFSGSWFVPFIKKE